MGATTIWERWDGQKTDSTFQDAGMNSFNHYAYGAIGDWMYRVSAGLEIKKPGYKEILFQPHPTAKLDFSKATYESHYGTISSGWERKDGKVNYKITVPANTTATVVLPVADADKITSDGKKLTDNQNFSDIRISGSNVMFETGSGLYTFEFTE